MSEIRYKALEKVNNESYLKENFDTHKTKISEIFSENVFDLDKMQEYLTEGSYYKVKGAIKLNKKIDAETAENIAKGMKKWAMDKGATHYTHWFQPLTGLTAEKHDAFYKPHIGIANKGIENLSGNELIQREPDASSFPTGGLRNTDQARGYTVWDPTSPAFILEIESGKTLYIPSVFISYSGESLGYKAPLLKSIEAISKAAIDVYHYFDKTANSVAPTLGWEQEYFVVDANLYEARPDLKLTGRTLFGRKPAKGQELDDHYFGSIPERVQVFMNDFENEALKLGIPVLTRHNEVAPNQFECAPMYEELNVSNDHNMLVMDIMHRVARKHNLRVLMHEKPFAGLNGSGKHNNWSMATDTGINLLSPGKTENDHIRFVTFFINIIKAISENADLVRSSISGSGNDHRLGANEAPPAIISIFVGSIMEELLSKFEKNGITKGLLADNPVMELDIPKIPEAILDNTDRNRTSPFPFVGNRFEFRAVGSTQNCSLPMMTLNAIVANQLVQFKKEVDGSIKKGANKQDAIVNVLKNYLKDAKHLIFNGDGYSKAWEIEAKKRGLSNIKTTPYALDAMISKSSKAVFVKNNILTEKEIEARYEVYQEIYVNKISTEARLVKELALTHIVPSAVEYQNKLMNLYYGYDKMNMPELSNDLKEQLIQIQGHVKTVKEYIQEIDKQETALADCKSAEEEAKLLVDNVVPYFDKIRNHADALEVLIDDSSWKLPKYRELLFVK